VPARSIGFHLFAVPEAWSRSDHVEWEDGLAAAGLQRALTARGPVTERPRVRVSAWRAPVDGRGPDIPVRVRAAPADGRFTFRVPTRDWEDGPVTTARVLRNALHAAAKFVDATYGCGPLQRARRVPDDWGDVTALDALTVLGPRLVDAVGWERLDALPGFAVESLPHGGVLLRLPFKGLTAGWSPDKEARLLDAEMHLGLRLNPERYPTLRGPARAYLKRRTETA
jgi:hypothetical protein